MLAGRIAYLVEQRGVAAATILAITFTTAAAATLRQRLLGVLGDAAHDLTITTFHALGLRLIKQWSGELGFGDGVPAVYGRDDARVLLREVASVLGLEVAPEARGREIDPWALSLSKLTLALDRFRLGWNDRGRSSEEHDDIDEELLRQLTKAYEAQLQQRGAVDFPSMLTLPLHLFESEPGALRVVQDTYALLWPTNSRTRPTQNSGCFARLSNATRTWLWSAIQIKQFMGFAVPIRAYCSTSLSSTPGHAYFRWTRTTGQRVSSSR